LGKLRILKIPTGKLGRMVEIGKIPPESGKLAGMIDRQADTQIDQKLYAPDLSI
jgi:hypothetical protein